MSEAFRSEWGRVVAHLIRVTGDWDLAEECAQDAFTKALERWPRDGIPTSPAAWLKTTARNRALDRLRRAAVGAAKLQEMAKRLVRAKQKIRDAAIPFRVPAAHQLPERTVAVLAVLYALFNEGYSASAGADLIRQNLCAEGIRLARLLAELMPDEPEALGLLALTVLHNARRDSRVDATGDLVTLEDQDRTSWDTAAIDEACRTLDAAIRLGRPGPYRLQAAIAASHAAAPTAAATDWAEIAALYARLIEMVSSPVVALNRAVAVAMADGPAAGLVLVEQLAADGY